MGENTYVCILTSLTLSHSVHPSFVNNVTVSTTVASSFVTLSIIYIGPVTLRLLSFLLLLSIDDDEVSLDDENDDENF
jgi:hypothetical protein